MIAQVNDGMLLRIAPQVSSGNPLRGRKNFNNPPRFPVVLLLPHRTFMQLAG
jgi:hypothetical protein